MHHIVCVHGIGQHSKQWASKDLDDGDISFATLLEELWDKYPGTSGKGKFKDNVTVHSVCYDDEIEKIFGTWTKYADDLKAGLKLSPLLLDQAAWFTDAIDSAAKGRKGNKWGYTHLMDLILFVGSPTLQDRLVNHAGAQIIKVANEVKDDATHKLSIIGHSMGCAMAHKAIQAMFNETVVTDMGPQTLKGDLKFENVTMVANTSYSLSRDRDNHYIGYVRPSLAAGEGCCYSWINVNHELDPVGRFQPFNYRKDPKWLDPRIETRGWHRDIPISRVSSKSIHSINHYFRDPKLHIPYLELVFDAQFSDDEITKAVDEFEDRTPEGKFKGLVSQLKLLDVSNAESFKDLFVALKSFQEAIKLFK
jgi:hypothetical protein